MAIGAQAVDLPLIEELLKINHYHFIIQWDFVSLRSGIDFTFIDTATLITFNICYPEDYKTNTFNRLSEDSIDFVFFESVE